MSYEFKTKIPKPKWYRLRNQLSNFFLWLAKKCYAENPEVYAFMMKKATDAMIYGSSMMEVPSSHEVYGRSKPLKKEESKNGITKV